MSRPLRIEYPNAFYHVMNRGASRQATYLIDDDYAVFLETLKETSRLFNIRIICYCLMPNHYHLLIQTPKANLSRAMRHLNGVYTQRFNRIHKKDGPLFRGRYKAILVQEDEYLTHLIRYIHLNPTHVPHPLKYPWSSHKQYLKAQDEEPWLHVRLGLAFFASKTGQAIKSYRSFIDQGVDPQTKGFYKKAHQSPILGNSDFLKEIKEKYIYGREKLSTEIPLERKITGLSMADKIIQEVSRHLSKQKDSLLISRRGQTNEARLMALSLTSELSGLKQQEIAEHFQIKSYRTVGTSCYRFRQLLKKNAGAKKRYDKIYQTCSQGRI